jgi:hypothetical protein
VIGILLLLFHNINAGIPMNSDMTVKVAMVELKPIAAMLNPATALPMAVPNQMVALFLVASFPAFLGDSL